ncbi:MAG: hypothetical protein EBT86_08425 [Actinobacteria bacterium]|nr:hypothetical protein [Actinomycetota bacterium]
MRYRLYTLIDITATGQYKNEEGKEQARSQQQNFDTVINTIGIRANVFYDSPPKLILNTPDKIAMVGRELSNIWTFDWYVESPYRFLLDEDDVGLLKKDFSLVPYIANLTETAKFKTNVFMPSINIHFEILR